MAPSSPILTVHDDARSITSTLLPLLHAHLPATLVLYRRLQYHIRYPSAHANKNGKVITVFPAAAAATPESLLRSSSLENGDEIENVLPPFLVSHIDVSRLTETTCYIFSSAELHGSELPAEARAEARRQLDLFLRYVRDALIPTRPVEAPKGWPGVKQRPDAPKVYRRSRILVGAVHETVLGLIGDIARGDGADDPEELGPETGTHGGLNVARTNLLYLLKYPFPRPAYERQVGLQVVRTDFPYLKYLVHRKVYEHSIQDERLLDGLVFRHLSRREEFELVISRTHIPRTVEMLSSIPNLGIYSTGGAKTNEGEEGRDLPIAWAFLGWDASLSSLHVEEEWRGRGLGGMVARELFRGTEEAYGGSGHVGEDVDIEAGWAHADVLETNMGSRRVMEKLGGGEEKVGWRVAWTEVDVGESEESKGS